MGNRGTRSPTNSQDNRKNVELAHSVEEKYALTMAQALVQEINRQL